MSVHVFAAPYLGDVYTRMLHAVQTEGKLISPRGKPNKEIRPVVLRTSEWSTLKGAGVNYKFACAEAMAIVCGWGDVAWLARFNQKVVNFSDDGQSFFGSYGARLYYQLGELIEVLKKDPQSRQGVVTIWNTSDVNISSKDLPCNTQLFVKIREGRLDLTVFRRSADLIWGVPYDHHVFWALLTTLSCCLEVKPGVLTEYIDSLHVYTPEANFYEADRVEKAGKAKPNFDTFPHWWPSEKSILQTRSLLTNARRDVEDNLTPYPSAPWAPLVSYLRGETA